MNRRTAGPLTLVLLGLGIVLPVACTTAETSVDPGADGGAAADEGGAGADGETPATACTQPSDCPSMICTAAGVCAPPGPSDGAMNGDETDVDCGGSAPKCDPLKKCKVASDCKSAVCVDKGQGLLCQAPAPDDGAKNGDETDIDCGGAKAPKCADGKGCGIRNDCQSDVCSPAGLCAQPTIDGVKNGTETDVDCGGPTAPRCGDLLACNVAGDCTSSVCKDVGAGLQCQPPSPTDQVKNGLETDVDCGGAGNPTCTTGQTCLAHADCASDGCAYDGKCALRRSCTKSNGGDTCGLGGPGGRGAKAWESCCATAPAGGVELGKYKVTGGRMRAFMERTKGNVRKFIQDARAAGKITAGATMRPEWDLYLPTAMDGCEQTGTCGAEELSDRFYNQSGQPANTPFVGIWSSAYRHLGGSVFNGQNLGAQGCRIDAPGSHTYYMDAATQTKYFGDAAPEHSQAEYDTKGLNCVNYLMAQAFCIWDGGRLETFAEWLAAWGAAAMPWGAAPSPWGPGSASYYANRYPTATDATIGSPPGPVPAGRSIEFGNFFYSYEYPNQVQNDYVVFMNAPGRMPGRGPAGHADIVGNNMEITSDITANTADPRTSTMRWTSNGSFEGHNPSKGVIWAGFTLVNKYGKQGLRCAY